MISDLWPFYYENCILQDTVLQNQVNPKINAPEVSKSAMKQARNFQHKSKISQKLNDIQAEKK